jgi:hypothetical protein
MQKHGVVRLSMWFVALCMLGTLLLAPPVDAGDASRLQHGDTTHWSRLFRLLRHRKISSNASRIQRGFEIAPVPLDLHGKNRALVGLGSYIVNAQGGCNDCHTAPPYAEGGDPFQGEPLQINTAGYLAGGQQFGPFTSRNLTPDPDTGLPAGLTFEEFLDVMQNGTDVHLEHPGISSLLQVMPWPVYGNMTERDLHAIYEYLRAIPSLPTPEP